jgi:2-desacetyl-2-hydroxyethyl bacteriochlorophyllide A dehydrogenase
MNRTSVIFKNPYEIELRRDTLPSSREGEVIIKTHMSAISAGTEMLVYRGQFPPTLPVDDNIKALTHKFEYPLKYGYTSIGHVVETGPGVAKDWLNRMVFCFNPHESHYAARLDQLIPIPADIDPLDALFLPNMETAVNFLMDGRPVIGENVVVFGQGAVGLLTTALLAEFPLHALVSLDHFLIRREKSLKMGAHLTLDPNVSDLQGEMAAVLEAGSGHDNADLIYEISGNPEALNQAVAIAGFGSRIVIGSWYGTKNAKLDMGTGFHRNRIRLISSQVSTLAPEFSGNWSKDRRLNVAWDMIRRLRPAGLVSHHFDCHRVGEAYELLDKRPQEAIQVILTWDSGNPL